MAKTFEIDGMVEVNRFLKTVGVRTNKKIMNQGLSKTGAILKSEMRQKISTANGGSVLAKQIKIWAGKRTPRALKWIGFQKIKTRTEGQREKYNKLLSERSGTSDRAKRTWLAMGAYWLEFGTLEKMTIPRASRTKSLSRAIERTGRPQKARIAPIAWFRNSVDAKMDPMMLNFSNNMGKVIDRHIKRTVKNVV